MSTITEEQIQELKDRIETPDRWMDSAMTGPERVMDLISAYHIAQGEIFQLRDRCFELEWEVKKLKRSGGEHPSTEAQ